MNLNDIYTLKEASDVWGISDSNIRNAFRTGRFDKQIADGLAKRSGSTYLITKQAMLNVFGQSKKEELIMKTLIVEKTKKFDHIIGEEYKEEYAARDKNDVQIYIGSELRELDWEQVEAQGDDIQAIFDLVDGNHSIDLGDFYLNVEVKEFE